MLGAPLSAFAFASLLLGAMPSAAQEPDTSERFREAMSVCTSPGTDLAPRLERLTATGWLAVEPSQEDLTALGQASALIGDIRPTAETLYRQGPVRLVLDSQDGVQTCLLAAPNSAESNVLLGDLDAAGAVTETDGVRVGAMASISRDNAAGDWRTEVTLASAPDALAAYFVSQEDE